MLPLLAALSFAVQVHGHGPAVILIPGLASSGEVWDSTVARYEKDHELHVLTLAGFAGQPAIPGPLLATARRELAAYIRGHKLERPVVIGHSLGGMLALWLAAEEPGLVGKVVAVDGVPFLPALFDPAATAASAKPQAHALRQALEASPPEALAQQRKASALSMVTAPADQARVIAWGEASDKSAVARAMEELMTTDLRPRLSRVKAPVLFIASAGFTDRAAAQLAKVKDLRIVASATARHFVMLDDPALFFATLDQSLGEAR